MSYIYTLSLPVQVRFWFFFGWGGLHKENLFTRKASFQLYVEQPLLCPHARPPKQHFPIAGNNRRKQLLNAVDFQYRYDPALLNSLTEVCMSQVVPSVPLCHVHS